MNANPNVDMAEVTRLTRAGRLDEATALLQGQVMPAPLPLAGAPAPGETNPFFDLMRAFGTNPWSTPAEPAAPSARQEGHGRFEARTFANAAGSRSYKLYIPPGYTGAPLPLVVMLHGCNQSPDDFAAGTRMNVLADELNFLVAYPAQSQSANSQRCWNWFNPSDQLRGGGEPSIVAGITCEIVQTMNADPRRIYIAGLSAGGAAASTMASAYPDLYAAVCVHSGLACGAARDLASAFGAMQNGGAPGRRGDANLAAVPTIVFHGDRDTTVHSVNGDHVMTQAKGAGDWQTQVVRGETSPGHRYTRTVQSGPDGVPVHEQWVLHGGGHAWSGGSAAGSFTDPHGADASRDMLRFFFEHARAG
jgi:poly(hydroxyalkanoate) depolymerase family esterase